MSENQSTSPEHAVVTPDPQSVEGLFVAALGHASPQERETFLNEACGDDADRRRRVEALLRAYDDAGSFLEHPPIGTTAIDSFNLDFLTPSDDPSLLGLLGPYEVYEVLGRGGMGIVLRARDPKLNRVVAIKVLAPELAANPLARRRFLREAQAAAAISHPHVVTIHAVGEGVERRESRVESPESRDKRGQSHSTLDTGHSTLPYLVMECIVGQTLQQKLDKQGSLRLTETLRIGQQVAEGLAAAHRQGLVHRDIKPANVLLENGVERVKITDFGLARLVDDVSITRTGEVSGTPQYMSPEQAGGEPLDHKSDLFSLGCVLYAMCTGRSPFRATSLAAAIRRTCDDTPRPIQEINPETPPWLIEIINQLLEKNPADRIQSAEEVTKLLSNRLAGLQRPLPTSKPTRHRISRRSEAPTPVPSDRRVAKGLLVCGLIYLVMPWLLAGAEALLFGEPRFMKNRGSLAMPTILGLVMMLVGWTILLIFDRRSRPGGETERDFFAAWDRGRVIGRWLISSAIWLICGVIFVGIYSATSLPQLPRHLRRDFGTTVFPIVLLASGLLVIGIFLRLPFFLPTHSSHDVDRSGRWDIRRIGRTAIWSGLAVIAAPWLIIAFGFLIQDGDPMEFGGGLVFAAAILGVLTIIMGCVTLLVAYSGAQRHPERDVPHRSWRERAHAGRKDRSSVLGWVLVPGLVLIPILLVISIGVYTALERAKSNRLADATRRIQANQRREAQAAEQRRQAEARRDSPTDVWNAAATATFRFDPTALGNVGIGMDRPDAAYGMVLEQSHVLIRAGDMRASYPLQPSAVNEIMVPPGKYAVWVSGREFGWSQQPTVMMGMDMMGMGEGMMGMGGAMAASSDSAVSKVADVEIHEGDDPQNVILAYDWQDIASRPPRWFDSSATRDFYWNGDTYTVNWAQAQVIQKLLVAFAAGAPDVHQALLTVEIGPMGEGMMGAMGMMGFGMMGGGSLRSEDGRALGFVEDVFEGGQHPAWGTLIVPGEAAGTYRLAESVIPPPPASESRSESSTSEPFRQQEPPPFPKQPEAAPQAFPQGREGVLNIDIRDDGLVVAVRRISAFGGFVPGTEQQIADVGINPLRLPTGEYEVLIRDTQFGWGDRKQTVVVGREMTELVVERDLAEYAQSDFHGWLSLGFRWDGTQYILPYFEQRIVVSRLLEAFSSGHPEVDEQKLLEDMPPYPQDQGGFGTSLAGMRLQKKPETLADLFDHPHQPLAPAITPAWGSLIVPGEKEGTYRLKPVPRGTLKVTVVDEGMLATVRPVDPQADVDPRTIARMGTQSWELPPGDYQVAISDYRVGWQFFSTIASIRTETVRVTEGETTNLRVDRRFTDYVEVPQPDSGFFGGLLFRWFPQGSLAGSNVTSDQAACVSVLLQALADGQPQVAEAELLKRAELQVESLSDVFEDIDKADQSPWKQIIVPGETAGTWRLKRPPEEATGGATTRGDEPVDAVRPRADDLPPGEPMGHVPFSPTFQMWG